VPGLVDAPRMYRFLRRVLPPVVTPYFSMHVEGVENLPVDAPAILAMNHLSFIDSIVVPLNVPGRPVYYLGKADYFDSWRTRWFFAGVGVVPVLREGGDAGKRSLDTGVQILRGGDLIGIYPEGTRSPDGRLYRGKTGPVRMALEAEVPIIPTAVAGTDKAMPTGTYLPRRHPISVRFGKPLDFSRYYDRKTDPFVLRSATDELMYEIMMLSGQEYVDEYAAKIKKGEVRLDDDAADDPVGHADAEAGTVPSADEAGGRRAG
jgi:1-acyl-sn-glycerol-3-phosphate acyltransferase